MLVLIQYTLRLLVLGDGKGSPIRSLAASFSRPRHCMEKANSKAYLGLGSAPVFLKTGPLLGVAITIGVFIGVSQTATARHVRRFRIVSKPLLVMLTMANQSGSRMMVLSNYSAFGFPEFVAAGT